MTEAEWLTCDDPLRMLDWLCAPMGMATESPRIYERYPSDRNLRLFAVGCCRQVWNLLVDSRSRAALEALEYEADYWPRESTVAVNSDIVRGSQPPLGFYQQQRLTGTLSSSDRLAWNAADAVTVLCDSMLPGDLSGLRSMLESLARAETVQVGKSDSPKERDGRSPTYAAAILRDIIGNPFRPFMQEKAFVAGESLPGPSISIVRQSWLTPTVVALAQAAYDQQEQSECKVCRGKGGRWDDEAIDQWYKCQTCNGTGHIENGTLDPSRLSMLADALEEAGCVDEEMLRHCRGLEKCPDCENGLVGDSYDRGMKSECLSCRGTGLRPLRAHHVRGCWVLDLILGKE